MRGFFKRFCATWVSQPKIANKKKREKQLKGFDVFCNGDYLYYLPYLWKELLLGTVLKLVIFFPITHRRALLLFFLPLSYIVYLCLLYASVFYNVSVDNLFSVEKYCLFILIAMSFSSV
jgi:hypothetical protein